MLKQEIKMQRNGVRKEDVKGIPNEIKVLKNIARNEEAD